MKTKKIRNKHESERNIATWRDNRIFRKNNFPEKTQSANYTIVEESPMEKDNFFCEAASGQKENRWLPHHFYFCGKSYDEAKPP